MISAVALLMLAVLTLTGCTSEASNIGVAKDKRENVVDTGFSVSTVGSYDSADTAVVLSTDASNKAVSLINMETGKQYTLYYDGTTYVKDKYEGPMTISQIKAGDVVDITFLKGKKKLASIQKSPKAWVFDGVSNYDLAGANRTASIGSQTYSLPAGVVVLSNGRRMGTEEVVSQDQVTISGIDHKIYSVNVDKGHGYLRLKNEQPLLGGWIEVGNRVIRQISEDMLLTVPEGSYQVVLDNNGIGCVKEITVERDKEVLLDVGDVKIAEDKTGIILFEVTPASAKISVDGKPIETGTAVELRYGIHQVVVEASGYDTLTRYIQVGSERAAITFTLEETRKANNGDSSVSGNYTERTPWQDTLDTISKNSVSKNDLPSMSQNALTTSNNNKVYVDSPKGVEVFLDGNYMGIAPVRFTKSPGRHEITLKKAGYKTKSYSIYLENNKRDETYSFSDLEKEGTSN
ncbi:MAG: PEGA domain-containing protein, partial [Lachnospiraceae bacterium]|nr:PEGA domain-containing protein [Lachnospiraceae bacterium]